MFGFCPRLLIVLGLVSILWGPVQAQSAGSNIERIVGKTDSSSRWQSGWINLVTPTDFAKGDRLRLTIGGAATRIMVRLRPKDVSPDSSTGIVNGPIDVKDNRIVEVTLETERKNIVQISVHGGPNPWGKFPLGGGNGAATLEVAELIRK